MSFESLLTPVPLPSGAVLPNRLVMAPMVVQGSDPATGHVTDEDVVYAARRSQVAGTLISAAAYVTPDGKGFDRQMSIADDACIPGLRRLATAMRQDGARALVQLYHGGRE